MHRLNGASKFYTTNWFTPNGQNDDWNRWGNQVGNVNWAFSQISNLMAQQTCTYWYYGYPYSQEPVYRSINNHATNTYPSVVQNQIINSYNNGWFSTTLYVGHMSNWPPTAIIQEDFENWGSGYPWHATGNFQVLQGEQPPECSGSYVGVATTSQPSQAQIGLPILSNSIAQAAAWVKFNSLQVPQGGDNRLELLSLSGNGWEYSAVAAVTNPNGVPVWTLEIYEGGNAHRYPGPEADSPKTGKWYKIDLTRDLSNGQAKLYVTMAGGRRVLQASRNCFMTYDTNWIGVGIAYQSASGYNQVIVDEVIVKRGPTKYGFRGTVPDSEKWNLYHPANPTYDLEHVYATTSSLPWSNERFVFLWVCDNAAVEGSYPGRGMAYSWSRGAIHNNGWNDGYRHPDGSGYAFISFEGASPWLYEYMGTYGSYPGQSGQPNIFKYFLVFFYWAALTGETTVNQALNIASYLTGYYTFAHAKFAYPNQGYWMYMPPFGGEPPALPYGYFQGFMRVYGDGNIYLPHSQNIYTG